MTKRSYGITVPAEARWLKLVRAFCRPILVEVLEEAADRVLLALDECGSNVIKHRCPSLVCGGLSMTLDVYADKVVFRFDRFCRAEDLGDIRPRDLEDVRPGGLGTHLVATVMDSMRYEADPTNSEVQSLILEKLRVREEDGHGSRP